MLATNAHYHHTKEAIALEEKLILAAKKDPKAFAPLYDKYYIQIFRFILKRVGNGTDAADVTSQVFVKAILNIGKYEFRGLPFTSWLHMVARNELNLLFRSKKYSRAVDVKTEYLHQLLDEVEEHEDDGRMQLMLNAIRQLKMEEIELLEMRYFEKRPFKEVAEILGISEANAKVRMHRVMKRLKELCNNE